MNPIMHYNKGCYDFQYRCLSWFSRSSFASQHHLQALNSNFSVLLRLLGLLDAIIDRVEERGSGVLYVDVKQELSNLEEWPWFQWRSEALLWYHLWSGELQEVGADEESHPGIDDIIIDHNYVHQGECPQLLFELRNSLKEASLSANLDYSG